jgi:hypothetical protein
MKQLIKENLGCMIGDFSYSAVFYADDILLMSASKRKMQRMVDICHEYGVKFGISFNASKSKWFTTDVDDKYNDVVFQLGGVAIEHVYLCIPYLGVKFIMKRHKLVVDISDRIRKFNCSAYNVLLNSSDLSETIRCEIIAKKCLPVLVYGLSCGLVWQDDMHKLHVAYRKIYRHIFKLSLRSPITELLNVFGIKTVADIINKKRYHMICNYCLCGSPEVKFSHAVSY